MSIEATGLRSRKISVISLSLMIGLLASLGAPLELGYLDLAVYQLPVFLLLRYVSAIRISIFSSLILVGVAYFVSFPIGVYAELMSMIVLLLALDTFASSGRAEHRLLVALLTLLLVCFPLYTATLTFFREETILLAAAHASTFLFSAVFSLVVAELIWAVSTIAFSGFFQGISRHEEMERASIRSLGTVFISVLVTTIFLVFLQIWSGRWDAVLTTTTQDLVDQSARSRLGNDMHQVELEIGSTGMRFAKNETPWLFIGERYALLGMAVDEESSVAQTLNIIDSEWMSDELTLVDLINEQMSKFHFRASMGPEFARLNAPLFLDLEEKTLPVYSDVIASQGRNTFSSFLMYLEERDQPVRITNVIVTSGQSSGPQSDTSMSFVADFSEGEFEGATVDTENETYTFTGLDWAGWANTANIYPLSFPEGGSITFTASAESPTHVYFKFEYLPYPNTTPEFYTKRVLVDSSTPTEYTVVFGEKILFVIDKSPLGLTNTENTGASEITFRRLRTSDSKDRYLGAQEDQVIDSKWMGGTLWSVVSTNPYALSRLGALNKDTMLRLPISTKLVAEFDSLLPSTDLLVADLKVWPRLQVFFLATTTMALFFTVSLLFTSTLTMFLVGRLIKPITRLLQSLEELKLMHTQMGESNTAIEPVKIETKALSLELNNMQNSIVWFSNEVVMADHQLRSAVTGYEALLSSLPLGLMEIDRDYQLRFRNEAMSQITGDSAEASYRLRQRGEQLFESGETIDEYALSLEGQPQRNLLLAITPRKNDEGDDSGFWLLVTDLTKQKAMDSQLLQTAKLATLGEMSTGMAHELNQPLNIIKLALSNLTNSLKKGRATEESIMSRLERIDSAVDRAATIIDHMRAFGRVAGEDFAPFNIASAVNAAADLVREPMVAKGVKLINHVEEPVWVEGNTIQFEQVLINMVNNARDAILDSSLSGAVTLRQALEEGFVTVTIEDTGGGIPPEVLPHIFEPFYTTKAVGKGTGLGGSISFGIIQDMQGTIWAENVSGGAKISIRLPIFNREKATALEIGQ